MAHLGFNANNVKPMEGRGDPLPAGWYVVRITESELVNTKNGTGLRLNMTAEVIHSHVGAQANNGRKVFIGLNMRNDNPKAAEIGQQELSAIAHAVGVLDVQDSQQLHGIPFWVRLRVRPADGQYEASNEPMNYQNQTFIPPAPVAAAPAMTAAKPATAPAAGFGTAMAPAAGFGTAMAPAAGFGAAAAPAPAPAAAASASAPVQQPWAAQAPAPAAAVADAAEQSGGVGGAPWATA